MKAAFVIGTFDTKAEELLFVRDQIRAQGVPVIAVDVSTTKHDVPGADVSAAQVAAHHPAGASAVFTGERGSAVAAMAAALVALLRQRSDLGGII
ncbi:MAG TPA: Tm-1-like ATP-binding domain-containing protein, partial [Steroidobacteraceae bacterium]|nr:Tm-1-like ATP-binding domain-containing protein [Steroidobacteraceae bacterium]